MSQDWVRPNQRFVVELRTLTHVELPALAAPAHRVMYDAVGADAAGLVQFHPQLVAGYLTGSGVIPWTTSDWFMFPDAIHVKIDQGGAGAPVFSANVMDVEPGAYRPPDVPAWVAHSTAPRPTVYCDRNDLPAVLAGFTGPVWLAWPGWAGEPLPSPQIVAVQNNFASAFDSSVVLDPTWPGIASPPTPTPPPAPSSGADMINGTLDAGSLDFVPFAPGAFTRIFLYHDFTPAGASNVMRVAIHSVAAGYTIVHHGVTHSVPEVVDFPHTDVDGVSLHNLSTVPIGWTLA